MNNSEFGLLIAEAMDYLTEKIAALKAENLSLKTQLAETHSALIAAEIRENNLLTQHANK